MAETKYNSVANNDLTTVKENQILTDTFADLGTEIAVHGCEKLGIWINLDINDSTGVTIRALSKVEKDGADEYTHLSDSEYIWVFADADQKIKLPDFEINRLINYVQLQVKATVVGGTAGIITSCKVTKSFS